ncbi:MAG TPA: DUF1549 domain-containing protein [Gemmataceae bacterium]|nr:DUF1549 domain-containing protein [Gemmataceae bacterium]
MAYTATLLGLSRGGVFRGAALLALGLPMPRIAAAADEPAKPAKSANAEIVHLINEKLAEKWQANKLTPSNRCSDYEFIRRVSLDIIGRVATPKELIQFFKDAPEVRRSLLIDRLLKSEEYAKNFANLWTVLLMTRSGATDPARSVYHEQMHDWLEKRFAENMAWKEIIVQLLTATGKTTKENGAVNYILAHLGEPVPPGNQEGHFNMVPVTARTTRLFLGIQTQCTQCHDHPFNPGKQLNFWGINAFFRQVDRKGDKPMRGREPPVLELVDDPSLDPSGTVFYETRRGVVWSTKPYFFLDKVRLPGEGNRREKLAELIASSEYFPKAYVNRIWQHFFGRGFTNPVDDFGEHNEPSHPELLNALAADFGHYGYDTKQLIRWICNSNAYSLSSVANRTNASSEFEPFFSRMLLKAMTPEQLFESLLAATRAEMFESKETREELRKKWLTDLTTNFGDDEGNEVTFNGTVVQALMMMNGGYLNKAIASKGHLANLVKKESPNAILDYLYKAALNRPPTSTESSRILKIYRTAPVKHADGLSFWQDVFWALLNSNEFILNH